MGFAKEGVCGGGEDLGDFYLSGERAMIYLPSLQTKGEMNC